MSYTKLPSLFLLLALGACGTVDRRVNPDTPDAVGGAALESQDIRAVADKMMRDILASGILRTTDPSQRASFYVIGLENHSSDVIDKEIMTTKIQTELHRALGRQVLIIDRSTVGLEEVKKERAAKRSGAVTSKESKGLAGADYVLKGTIKERVKQSAELKSVYYLLTFQLVDLESSEMVWINDYETKFESERSVITR
jgi:PBP1b-binding outer membrane lipoprotein LpoB